MKIVKTQQNFCCVCCQREHVDQVDRMKAKKTVRRCLFTYSKTSNLQKDQSERFIDLSKAVGMDFDYSDNTDDFSIVFDMCISREHIEIEEDFNFSFSCTCSIFCLRHSFSASSKGNSFGQNWFGYSVILQKD